MHGWVIDKDYLADDVISSIAGRQFGELPDVKPVRFTLYDDDGIRYYSGLFYTSNPDGMTEDASDDEAYELWAWGAGYAGTTSLRFHGHPEWDIG